MRIRYLKPGFFLNEVLAECEPLARLLFEGLWLMADREGRLEERIRRMKVEILPYDDCDVQKLLDQLETSGFIHRYRHCGRAYIAILNFVKHQRPHPKEPPSVLPSPDLPDPEPFTPSPVEDVFKNDGEFPDAEENDRQVFNGDGNSNGEQNRNGDGDGASVADAAPAATTTPWQVAEFVAVYGEEPPIHGQQVFLRGIPNDELARTVWRGVLQTIWKGNNHDPTKYGNLVDRFRREYERAKREVSGGGRTTSNGRSANGANPERDKGAPSTRQRFAQRRVLSS